MSYTFRLTGRRRYRVDDDGRVVVQVEYEEVYNGYHNRKLKWRDATVGDVTLHGVDPTSEGTTEG